MPPALVEPCILAGAPVGGLVLDPFTGSGTVGAVALALGRRFVGCELNPEYAGMARQRIGEAASQELLPLFDPTPTPKDAGQEALGL
jgi:DNA modification methylase